MSTRHSPTSRFFRTLAAVTATALTTFVGATQASGAEKVTFAYPTNINLSNAPTLMAIGMGYFKDEGLDADVMFFQGSAVMLPQLTQKHLTFGWMSPEVLITANQPGRTALPTKMFYNGIYLSPYELVVREDSPVKSLADLKGKKIGVGAMSWANLAITKTMLKDEGLELQKDYGFLPVGVGATAFRALEDGSIAALNLFDTFHTQMENSGTKLRRLPVQEQYQRLFSNGWIAHEDTLRERPELVVKFSRAAAKGVVACNANPEACVKNFWNLYPDTKPSQGSEEKKLADAVRIVKVRLATMIPQEGVSRMGYYTNESLKDYVKVLYAGGQIPTDKIQVDSLYTNDFVAQINDFDVNAVIEAAKAK